MKKSSKQDAEDWIAQNDQESEDQKTRKEREVWVKPELKQVLTVGPSIIKTNKTPDNTILIRNIEGIHNIEQQNIEGGPGNVHLYLQVPSGDVQYKQGSLYQNHKSQ